MPRSVALTHVVIWYAVSRTGVEARVRTYAGDRAIEESSEVLTEPKLTAHANADGRATWDESDILALIPHDEPVWVSEAAGTALTADIEAAPEG